MATLSNVIDTLNESNAGSQRRHAEIKVSLEKGISDISQSISSIQRAGIRIPGLSLLLAAITDNPISRSVMAIPKAIGRVLTAPFRAIIGLTNKIKDTVSGIIGGLVSIFKDFITAPLSKAFGFLKALFTTNFEKANNKLLSKILDSINSMNLKFDSFFKQLKRDKLDSLRQADDGGGDISADAGDNQQPEKKRGGFLAGFNRALKIAVGLMTGIGLALVAEITGFDKFLKAFFISARFKNIFKIPASIVETIGSAFRFLGKSVSAVFDIIKSNTFIATLGDMIKFLFGDITKKLSGFTRVFSSIGQLFSGMGKIASGAFKILGNVFRAVKIFARFTFLAPLITLFDFIKGAFNGFVDAEGGIFKKLLGALEGGVLGIIKGITAGLDVLIFGLPAFLLEKLGFTGLAEKFRGFSITALVDDLWSNIKGLFSKLNFKELTTRLANFKDKMLINLSKISFSIPDITIPIPNFLGGGDFRLLKGFTVGVSEAGAREAQRRIDQRNAALIQSRNSAEQESSARLNNAQTQLSNTIDSRNISAIQQNNAIDARSTQNSTTVLNQAPMPSSSDGFDRMAPI
jgi:hypothetical protein